MVRQRKALSVTRSAKKIVDENYDNFRKAVVCCLGRRTTSEQISRDQWEGVEMTDVREALDKEKADRRQENAMLGKKIENQRKKFKRSWTTKLKVEGGKFRKHWPS